MTEKNVFSLEEQQSILVKILDFVNRIEGLPVEAIGLDEVDETPSMCIGTINGGGKGRFNVVGGYFADFPFALYLKINTKDTQSRIDAISVLTQIGVLFDEQTRKGELPELEGRDSSIKIEMISLPHQFGEDETGNRLYQAMCNLNYRHKSIYE